MLGLCWRQELRKSSPCEDNLMLFGTSQSPYFKFLIRSFLSIPVNGVMPVSTKWHSPHARRHRDT